MIFKWYIIGDGEDKEKLLKLVKENGLEDIFILLGARDNPYPYMKNANLFVLQSYYEGRPLVVDEAMIVGTPVLITNYSSSNEQVSDGVYGYIVKNEEIDIYLKLKDIIKNPEQLNVLRRNLEDKDWHKLEDCSVFISAMKG